MDRFINGNTEGLNLSTLTHASLNHNGPPRAIPILKFYRGPLPATSTTPDNVYNFYNQQKYFGQRVFEPNINGSL
jgi:hypothetical protein